AQSGTGPGFRWERARSGGTARAAPATPPVRRTAPPAPAAPHPAAAPRRDGGPPRSRRAPLPVPAPTLAPIRSARRWGADPGATDVVGAQQAAPLLRLPALPQSSPAGPSPTRSLRRNAIGRAHV